MACLNNEHFGATFAHLDAQLRHLRLALCDGLARELELLTDRRDVLLLVLNLDLQRLDLRVNECKLCECVCV